MRLLLDTHVAIWACREPDRLPSSVRDAIIDHEGQTFVSTATIWEIAIKHPLSRHTRPPFAAHEAIYECDAAGFAFLDIDTRHAAFVERLPLHHADPFDRLIVAQAITEGMVLVTRDSHLARYDVPMLPWQ